MIIECPKCQFSGRIPSYALETPYNARCPRCRFRFELQTLLSSTPAEALDDPGIDGLESVDGDPRAGDPSSSAYELKAINEDFAGEESEAADEDEWRDEIRATGAVNGPVAAARRAESEGGDAAVGSSGFLGASWSATDPWYGRVLQAWAVAFLIWAALILGRSLQWMFTADAESAGPGHLVATVVSVVLLVPGSAALFLLVDLSRYLRNHTPATANLRVARRSPAPGLSAPGPRGAWSQLFGFASAQGSRP
ncbi:hypothetical protein [Aquisphaera insulae]|uniref:hypothetical protein n=1 Tax=Aquisphaera insulae TaxID=2712864 RepID=UPI0013EBDF4B|nr:hypothetical protein [Aquisphaera insulae]